MRPSKNRDYLTKEQQANLRQAAIELMGMSDEEIALMDSDETEEEYWARLRKEVSEAEKQGLI